MNNAADLATAKRCLTACAGSYTHATISDSATDTQVLMVEEGAVLIIAFRGSTSLRDWMIDSRAWRVPGLDAYKGSVHAGFKAAAMNVRSEVFDYVAKSNKPLLVTGHSLGGALAVLMAAMLEGIGRTPAQVITFGQPRVGDWQFAAQYEKTLGDRTYRVVNEEDCVPRLPGVLLGYRHCGHEVFLPSDQRGYILNPSVWRKLWSDSVSVVRDWWHCRENLFHDHALDKYAERIGGAS